MNSNELISDLANKGLLDEETVSALNDVFREELKEDIERYKSISIKCAFII